MRTLLLPNVEAVLIAGSATLPSVRAANDTNTGIYWPAADTLAIATGGVLRASIGTSWGIGGDVTSGAFLTLVPFGTTRTLATSVGFGFHQAAATQTDDGAARTLAIGAAYFLGTPTVANASNAVTLTDAATLYIAGAVAAGTNLTLTRTYAVFVDGGDVRFDENLVVGGATTLRSANPGLTLRTASSTASVAAAVFEQVNTAGSGVGVSLDFSLYDSASAYVLSGGVDVQKVGGYTSGSATTFDSNMILQVLVDNTLTDAVQVHGDQQAVILASSWNLKLGATNNFGTTTPTRTIFLFEGTAPAGTITDGGGLYARDAAGITELTWIDSGGTVSNVT